MGIAVALTVACSGTSSDAVIPTGNANDAGSEAGSKDASQSADTNTAVDAARAVTDCKPEAGDEPAPNGKECDWSRIVRKEKGNTFCGALDDQCTTITFTIASDRVAGHQPANVTCTLKQATATCTVLEDGNQSHQLDTDTLNTACELTMAYPEIVILCQN